MNKIANWVFGSFFRTIGRLLVFILLGIIIANFIDFGDIKDNFSITNLFFTKVNASTYYRNDFYNNAYTDENYTTTISNTWNMFYINNLNTKTTLNIDYNYSSFNFNQHDILYNNVGELHIPFQINVPLVSTSTTSTIYGSDYCDRWTWGAIDSYNNVIRWDCSHLSESQDSTITDREYLTPQIYIKAIVRYSNQNSSTMCDVENNYLKCPVPNNAGYIRFIGIYSYVRYSSNTNNTYNIGLSQIINYYKDIDQEIVNSVDQQTQQQQQNHEETQNYLEDTNTTQANTQGQDFINNFSNNTHGLTGIITAPLNAIQSLASSTCSNLVLPLPFVNNKSLTLPCMSTIYSQHFGVFYTMYQGIILALVSYWVCVRLFTLVKGFKDPDDDKIEVIDL